MYGDDTLDMGMSGGPMMEGTWYNPNNGDSFTVKDTYFEGDQLYIITMDGRRINGDMLASYVQSDGPISKKPDIDPGQGKIGGELLRGLDTEMQSEMNELLNKTLPVQSNDPLVGIDRGGEKIQQNPQIKQTSVEDEDSLLLRRMMDRVNLPKVTCTVKWSKFPSKQIEMLDLLGVPQEKVIEYIFNKLDYDSIAESIKQALVKSFADAEEKEKKSK